MYKATMATDLWTPALQWNKTAGDDDDILCEFSIFAQWRYKFETSSIFGMSWSGQSKICTPQTPSMRMYSEDTQTGSRRIDRQGAFVYPYTFQIISPSKIFEVFRNNSVKFGFNGAIATNNGLQYQSCNRLTCKSGKACDDLKHSIV
uniref:Uncharacterized protein n=1 Tax=Romanomermis culicivorax TaxID=13658 RepID=A0A915JMA9_ROMCU